MQSFTKKNIDKGGKITDNSNTVKEHQSYLRELLKMDLYRFVDQETWESSEDTQEFIDVIMQEVEDPDFIDNVIKELDQTEGGKNNGITGY